MPSIKQSVETSVINDKGELVSKRANKTLSWGAEPSYIKLYLQDILYLSDIPNKHTQVLYELLKRSTYAGDKDGMQVIVNSYVKNCIKDKLGLKNVGSISNAITVPDHRHDPSPSQRLCVAFYAIFQETDSLPSAFHPKTFYVLL